MKNRNTIIIVAVSVVLLIAGAVWFFIFRKSNLSKYIPKNAMTVIKVNTLSLAGKLDFDEIENMKSYNDMVDQMDEGGIDMSKLFKNPLKSGISLKDNIYLFTELNDEKSSIGMVFGISDPNNFKDFIEKFASDANLEYKTSDEIFIYTSEGDNNTEMSIVWNDDACVIYYDYEESLSKSKRLLNQESEESILSNESYIKSEDKGGDASLYINYKNINKLIENEIENLDSYYPKKIKDFYKNIEGSTFVLNFNKNHISIDGIQFFKDENKTEEFNILGEKGLDSKAIDFISSNGKLLMGMTAVINMNEVFNILKTIPKYDEGISELENIIGLSESEIKNLLNGNISMALTDMKMKDIEKTTYEYNEFIGDYEFQTRMVSTPIPIYCIQIGIKESSVYKKMIAKISELGEGKITLEGNKMILPTNSEYGDVLVVNLNDRIIITNDASAAKEIDKNKKGTKSINSDLQKLFSENPIACYVCLNFDNYGNKQIKSMLSDIGQSDKEYQMTKKLMGNFSSFSFDGSLKTSKIGIHLKKEGDQNSLMRMILAIDELVADGKKL
jgi:hypothetical protein